MARLSPHRARIATGATATAALAIAVVSLAVQVVPASLSLLEGATGRGFGIESALRVYFSYAVWLLLQAALLRLWVLPVVDARARIALGVLAAAGLALIAVWTLDRRAPFGSETSALAPLQTAVLAMGALAAWGNRRSALARAAGPPAEASFWALLGLALALAALDGPFGLRERLDASLASLGAGLGIPAETGGWLVAAGYALAGAALALVFRDFLRAELRRGLRLSGWLFLGAIALYGAAALGDVAGALAARTAPRLDPEPTVRFLGGTLAFAAAALLVGSLCVRLVEREGGRVAWLVSRGAAARPHPALRAACAASVAATIAASALLALLPHDPPALVAEAGAHAAVYRDARHGLDDCAGVWFDPARGLLAANVGNGTVVRLDGPGPPRIVAGPDQGLASAAGLAFDGAVMFVADPVRGQVVRIDASGAAAPVAAGRWRAPSAVAVDAAGRLYVADAALAAVARVEEDAPVPVASSLDGLAAPTALAFGGAGELYVADPEAGAVFRIPPGGGAERFLDARQGLREPAGLVFRAERLWVSDRAARTVSRFDAAGRGGAVVTFAPRVQGLAGLDFDPDGELHVAVRSDYRPHTRIYRVRGLE